MIMSGKTERSLTSAVDGITLCLARGRFLLVGTDGTLLSDIDINVVESSSAHTKRLLLVDTDGTHFSGIDGVE